MRDGIPQLALPRVELPQLKLIEDIEWQVNQSMKIMRPFIEQAADTHRRINEMVAPINGALASFRTAMAPMMQSVARMQEVADIEKPTLEPRRAVIFNPQTIGPRYRYPSPEDIAYVVREEIEDYFGEKTKQKDSIQTKPVIPLPSSARWEDLELYRAETHDITVFYKKSRVGKYDYEILGLARKNTKDRRPNKQAELLEQLSVIYEFGGLNAPTVDNLAQTMKISKGACEKRKEALSKKLRLVFGIMEDPFHPYDPDTGYRTKFILKPEPLLRGSGDVHASGGMYRDEITPDLNDEIDNHY